MAHAKQEVPEVEFTGIYEQPIIYEEADNYAPNRFEYFAGKALQGLCSGRSERDLGSVVRKAMTLAEEMEDAIDSEKD